MVHSYKNLADLEKNAIANNGKPVRIWDDDGIIVGGKRFRMFQYGDINGHQYVTFINRHGKKWEYGSYYGDAEYLTIEYQLTKPAGNAKSAYIFNFILIREYM